MISVLSKWLNKQQPKGLVLPEYKTLSNHSGDIHNLPLYDTYYISLLQRDGENAVPIVKIGDQVNAGDVIARPTSHLALHRHAPTSGEVSAVVDIRESHPSGMMTKALAITADGLDTPTEQFPAIESFHQHDKDELLLRIFRAGIAGMGGAGFPTEKKINLEEPVETLIINGAECEPYLTCDDLLMRHHATEILQGALIFTHILSSKQILVGIEDNKPEAIAAMQLAAKSLSDYPLYNGQPSIEVHVMPTQYPMGSRYQIAHYLMGKKPRTGGRSYQSGFVCHNVATAKATYDAVIKGKPLTDRLVTFSGDGIDNPAVYLTKVGTDIKDIAASVGINADCQSVIFGGTMMGFSTEFPNNKPVAIKRETTAVLAFKENPQHVTTSNEQNCIRCGHCAEVCPMDLLPQQLQFYGKSVQHEQAENNRLFDCIECGLCTYVCPSDIPLVQIFQHSKGEIIAERQKKQASEHARIRFETRNERLAAEKAARAKKAAERRAKLSKNTEKTASAVKTTNTAVRKQPSNNQDLIAAALARTQAKKAQSTADTKSVTENKVSAESSNDKQDLIAAALARSQAKKAARVAENNTSNNTNANTQPSNADE